MKKILLFFALMLAFGLSAQTLTVTPHDSNSGTITIGQSNAESPQLQGLAAVVASIIVESLDSTQLSQLEKSGPIKLPQSTPTLDWLFNDKNGVFAFLLMLLMYLSERIPFLKKIDDKRRRALVVAVFLGIGVTVWRLFDNSVGWAEFGGMAIAFVSTQLAYIFGLAPMGLKTSKLKKEPTQ